MDTDSETTTQAVVVVEGEDSAISTEARASLDPVAKNFVTLLGGKKKFKCVHCDWETVSTSVRRRLEHLLAKGGGNTQPCTHARDKLSEADLAELDTIFSTMDQLFEKKRKAKKQAEGATSSLTLPKRQRKLAHFLRKKEKDAIDMAYARKIVMTMVKATYMDSPFTFDFYEVCVCVCSFCPSLTLPSRPHAPTLRLRSTTSPRRGRRPWAPCSTPCKRTVRRR